MTTDIINVIIGSIVRGVGRRSTCKTYLFQSKFESGDERTTKGIFSLMNVFVDEICVFVFPQLDDKSSKGSFDETAKTKKKFNQLFKTIEFCMEIGSLEATQNEHQFEAKCRLVCITTAQRRCDRTTDSIQFIFITTRGK